MSRPIVWMCHSCGAMAEDREDLPSHCRTQKDPPPKRVYADSIRFRRLTTGSGPRQTSEIVIVVDAQAVES